MKGSAIIRTVDPAGPDERIIGEMTSIMRQGGVIVFPTETFYGLGAHALNGRALERIYHLKDRFLHLPLLCLVDGMDRLDVLVKSLTPQVVELIETFWPGPLTLVLPARDHLPPSLLGPSGGVAVRWSPHPVAQALVTSLQAPVIGTSANPSGGSPPTSIGELSTAIKQGVQGVLNGGTTPGRAPSTVLDCTKWPGEIVREGAVSRDALQNFLLG